jgi:hypothetical protein
MHTVALQAWFPIHQEYLVAFITAAYSYERNRCPGLQTLEAIVYAHRPAKISMD